MGNLDLSSAMKFVLSACAALAVTATASVSPDQAIVNAHVEASANQTFRDASGDLKFPYLVPSGPYNQVRMSIVTKHLDLH